MLRRGATQAISRGYVSFVEKNNVGLVNYQSKLQQKVLQGL